MARRYREHNILHLSYNTGLTFASASRPPVAATKEIVFHLGIGALGSGFSIEKASTCDFLSSPAAGTIL